MSDYIKTDVTVNIDAIKSKIESVINDSAVMTEVHQTFAGIIDPWIPFDTGNMSQEEISISAECVTYYAEYARKQYYGTEFNHTRTHHPLATAYWDKVAMQTEKEHLAQEVHDIIVRRLNNG